MPTAANRSRNARLQWAAACLALLAIAALGAFAFAGAWPNGLELGVFAAAAVVVALLGWLLDRHFRFVEAIERSTGSLVHQAEEREAAILASATDAIVTIDAGGTITKFNPAAERMFGYTRAEALGREMAELIIPVGLRDRHRQGLARAVASGRLALSSRLIELPALRRDGEEFVAELSISRIGLTDPPMFTGFVRDITERKRIHDKLLQSEAYLDIVGRVAGVGGWEIDLASGLVHWSDQVCRIRDLAPGSVLGYQEMAATYSDEFRELVLAKLKACIEEGTAFDEEAQIVTATGRLVWVRSAGRAVRDAGGRIVKLQGALQDITQRKHTEEATHRVEVRLATTLESITDAFYTLDRDWRVTFANQLAKKWMQIGEAPLIGSNLWELFPAALGGPIEEQFRKAMQEQQPVEFEVFFEPFGQWFEARAYPSEEGLAVYFRDVTERRQSAKDREVLEAQLQEARKLEAIGRLAGGVAHDFNNVLGAMLGNAELARLGSAGNAPVLESLEEIRKAGHRAKELIAQILSFSRRQPATRRTIALADVVEESTKLLRGTLPAPVTLEIVTDNNTPPVLADPTQLGQVLVNLLTNASHAMQGGGTIGVRLEPVTVREPLKDASQQLAPGRYARLSIIDTGHGMDGETRQRIFEPFFTTKAPGEGTGLGLSVVHGIVSAHSGAITVRSEPGEGTRFDLYFPAAEGVPEGVIAGPPAPAHRDGHGEHILYLDDDEALVFLMERMLSSRGYRVSAFTDPDKALAAVRAAPGDFSLFVTDFSMRGMNGLDVARAVRAIRPDLPVVIASGYISEELSREAEGAGVRHLVFKPNVVTEFIEAVQGLLP